MQTGARIVVRRVFRCSSPRDRAVAGAGLWCEGVGGESAVGWRVVSFQIVDDLQTLQNRIKSRREEKTCNSISDKECSSTVRQRLHSNTTGVGGAALGSGRPQRSA